MGELLLTEEDMRAQRVWEDSIGHGAFFIDIHHLDGPGMDNTTWRPAQDFHYQIPYRILLPQRVENLLVAGRCVSVTHVALGSIRVMVQCALTGEAAGAAAAISLRDGAAPASRRYRRAAGGAARARRYPDGQRCGPRQRRESLVLGRRSDGLIREMMRGT